MKKLACHAALISVFSLAVPAHATVLHVETVIGYNDIEESDSWTAYATPRSGYSIYSGLSSPSGTTTASAAAQAAEGVLKAAVSAASGSSYYGVSGAIAEASWTVTFRMVKEELTGTTGRVRLPIQFEGTFDSLVFPYPAPWWIARAGTGFSSSIMATTESGQEFGAGYSSWMNIFDGYAEYTNSQSRWDATHQGYEAITPGRLGIDVDFIWGETISLTASLRAECGVIESDEEPNSFASCHVDAFRSSYWAGLTGVQSNGVLVTDYTIETDGYFDLSKSLVPQSPAQVPEPGTPAVLLIGLLALVTAFRGKELRK